MLDVYKCSLERQYEAALCMLSKCVQLCPDARWREPVANLTFCQAAFHAVFYTDLYLGTSLAELREQSFHQQHASTFGDYEELEDRPQTATYSHAFVEDYLSHCRTKAARVVGAETEASLQTDPGFDWLPIPRAEVHIYNIRHAHHHAAQLSLWLRINTGQGGPWVGSGWRDDK